MTCLETSYQAVKRQPLFLQIPDCHCNVQIPHPALDIFSTMAMLTHPHRCFVLSPSNAHCLSSSDWFFWVFFLESGSSCSLDWSQTCHVAKDDLELLILHYLHPGCQVLRCAPYAWFTECFIVWSVSDPPSSSPPCPRLVATLRMPWGSRPH